MRKPKQKGKFEQNRMFVVNDALRFSPGLAAEIGLYESLLFLQIEFLVAVSDHIYDGYKWTYQSVSDLNAIFPSFSRTAVARALRNLVANNYLIIGNYNRRPGDKTHWYRVNPQGCQGLRSITFLPY